MSRDSWVILDDYVYISLQSTYIPFLSMIKLTKHFFSSEPSVSLKTSYQMRSFSLTSQLVHCHEDAPDKTEKLQRINQRKSEFAQK